MDLAKQIRSDIVDILSKVDNIKLLKSIRHELKLLSRNSSVQIESQNNEPNFMDGVKPVREKVTLQEIMKEQDYEPISYKQFRQLVDEIEWQESFG